jgi:hypothetical protein
MSSNNYKVKNGLESPLVNIIPMSQTGAPTTGTWVKGDSIKDVNGKIYHCTTAGTPGTWEAGNLFSRTSTTITPINVNDSLDLGTGVVKTGEVDLNIGVSAPAWAEGKLFYDNVNKCPAYYNEVSTITHQVGQEAFVRCSNKTGSTIVNGSVVYISGADVVNDLPQITLARSDEYNTSRMIGVATHNIDTDTYGYVTSFGNVNDVNTSAYTAGDIIYLSPTSAGTFTKTRPTGGNFIIKVGIVTKISATVGRIFVSINPTEYTIEALQKLGWSSIDLPNLSFNNSNRTLTITPSNTDFHLYQYGIKYTKTSDSLQIPNTEGMYHIYYDLEVLQYILNPTPAQEISIIENNPRVAKIYWDVTNQKAQYFGYNLHKMDMSTATQSYIHKVFATRYLDGLAPTDIVADGSGDVTTHAQFGVGSGNIISSDITTDTPTITSTTGLIIRYLGGTSGTPTIRGNTNAGYSVLTAGTGRLAYNYLTGGNWTLAEVTNGDYVLYHVLAINSNTVNERVFSFVGIAQYASVALAQAGALTELGTLRGIGILPTEVKAIASFIFQTSNTYANAVKARIRSIDANNKFIDWRASQILASSGSGSSATSIFSDSVFQIYDNLAPTKTFQFLADNITAGNNRIITVPDRSFILNDIRTTTTTNLTGYTKGNGANISAVTTIPIGDGGTGQTTALAAREALGAQIAFHGLENDTAFTISYNEGTRVLSVVYSANAFVWINGVKYTKTVTDTMTAHANTTGMYYYYYDTSGTLVGSASPWDILSSAQLASVYYNATTAKGVLWDEEHPGPSGMSPAAHRYDHLTRGSQAVTYPIPSGYTLNSAGLTNLQYALASGTMYDEDHVVTTTLKAKTDLKRIYYRSGNPGAWVWNDTTTSGILDDATNIYYNQLNGSTWQLTPISSNNTWVNYYLIMSPENTIWQTAAVMGQATYGSLALAQAENPVTAIAGLTNLTDEFVYVYRMTYRRVSGSSPSNAQLASVQILTGQLNSLSASGVTPTDHNALTNLTVGDVHTQYVLLNGRAGSQIVYGGNAASENLTLSSTSDVTKGKIFFGVAQQTYFDGANNYLGLNTTTAAARLHVAESITTSPRGIMSSQHNAGTDGARLHLRKSRGTNVTPLTIVTGDMIGRLVGSAYDGTSYIEMASIDVMSTGTIGTNRVPTEIVFNTATDASPSVVTEVMRIKADQTVKIGSSSAMLKRVSGVLSDASAGTDYEAPVTKGNLTAGTNKISIGGTGTGAVIGTGVTVDVAESNLTLGNMGGSVGVTRGGTGVTTIAQGDIVYGSATNTMLALSKSTTANSFLKNSGTTNNPAWSTVNTTDLVTAVNGLLKGNGTSVAVASAGSDYQAPLTNPVTGTGTSGQIVLFNGTSTVTGDSDLTYDSTNNRLGIGISPTAHLHLQAGSTSASSAPIKLTTGTAMTNPEDGAIEYHSSHLYFTISSTRYQLDQQSPAWVNSQSRVYVRGSGAAISVSAGVDTKITYNTEDLDSLTEFDPVTNFRFTATTTGRYMITAKVEWKTPTTSYGENRDLKIIKNGNVTVETVSAYHSSDSALDITQDINIQVQLVANDYIEIFGNATDDTQIYRVSKTNLAITRIA